MKSALYLAAAVAVGLSSQAFSSQAFAAEQVATPSTASPAVAAESAALTTDANAQTVRKILLSQGYSNVSELNLDAKGRWAGTAVKDGKTVGVAMAMPAKGSNSKTN